MREFITMTWCDPHDERGERVNATISHKLGLDGEEGELDFCDECDEAVLGPIRKLLERARAAEEPVKPKRRSNGDHKSPSQMPTACPFCGQNFTTKKITADHIWSAHLGTPRPPQPPECPTCGLPVAVPQAMSRHRSVQHGYDYWAEAIGLVEAEQKKQQRAASRRKTTDG